MGVWINLCDRANACTCGKVNGHGGWLICFDDWMKEQT